MGLMFETPNIAQYTLPNSVHVNDVHCHMAEREKEIYNDTDHINQKIWGLQKTTFWHWNSNVTKDKLSHRCIDIPPQQKLIRKL
jgi:hypothetical protein